MSTDTASTGVPLLSTSHAIKPPGNKPSRSNEDREDVQRSQQLSGVYGLLAYVAAASQAISGPSSRIVPAKFEEYGQAAMVAARDISRAMGAY